MPSTKKQNTMRMPVYAQLDNMNIWDQQPPPPFHRNHSAPDPTFAYRTKQQFPQYPISPISPASSLSSDASASSSSTNSYASELELLRSMHVTSVTRGSAPCLPPTSVTPADFDFGFNFLPDIHHNHQIHHNHHNLQQQQQQHQLHQQALSLPTPPPSSPTSSEAFSDSHVSTSSSSKTSGAATNAKRPSSSANPSPSKRTRTCVSTKDFVPPDVSGLSKREARLVKNRAAAFLSRQRKREEFELMEIRVGELEQENERLRALVDGRPSSPARSSPDSSEDSGSSESQELDQLRTQLALAKDRENELMRRLEASAAQVKAEPCDPSMSDSESSAESSPTLGPSSLIDVPSTKNATSLGLMALLCALPSILAKSSSDSALPPSSQSLLENIQWDAPNFLPSPDSTSALGCSFEWNEPSLNPGLAQHSDMEVERKSSEPISNGLWKKIQLESDGNKRMDALGLGSLDISFSAEQASDKKIIVRIHSPAAPAETKDEALSPTLVGSPAESLGLPLGLPSPASDAAFPSFSFPSHDPSLDIPEANPFSAQYTQAEPLAQFFGMPSSPFDLAGCQPSMDASRRRVRIALRSFPQTGNEGGEWEVEVR